MTQNARDSKKTKKQRVKITIEPMSEAEQQITSSVLGRLLGNSAVTLEEIKEIENDQPDLRVDLKIDHFDLDKKDHTEIKSNSLPSSPIDPRVSQTLESQTPGSIKPQSQIDPSIYKTVTSDELDKVGFMKVANTIMDTLPSVLDPYELVVYLRLYRLSYGFHNSVCIVGNSGLTKATRISDKQVRRSLSRLVSLGLIKVLEVINTKSLQGTRYEIRVPIMPGSINPQGQIDPRVSQTTNKNMIDDHDPLKTDHHQSEVMMIYKNSTGNDSWTKSDSAAYEKLKHLSLQEISQLIKATLEKAHQKPASLAYFVKAYQNPTVINPAQKSAIKAKLAAIVGRKREAHVGTRYTIADLTFDVKAECIREGIAFDNDLFNEIIEKKN